MRSREAVKIFLSEFQGVSEMILNTKNIYHKQMSQRKVFLKFFSYAPSENRTLKQLPTKFKNE